MAKHPAFDEEQQALADNLKLIDELVALLKAGSDAGADREAKSAIAKLNAPDIDTLQTERPKPYFGRLKLNDPEYGPLDLYIGKVQIPNMHADVRVMSWKSAMAATWYKTSLAPAKVSLDRPKTKTLPKRKAVVEVNGRRLIAIENANLVEINDSFWIAESGGTQVAPAAGDSASDQFLTKVLERDRSDAFEDIVPTITPDQYELIADDKGGPRVIDGVPGSGKTTVAFHRLSYLVSGEREVGKRLNSNRVLALGPSPLFVLWSGSIRSSLQLDSVNYFTVEDWMWRWLAAQKIELGALTGTEPDQETLGRQGLLSNLEEVEANIGFHVQQTTRLLRREGTPEIRLDLFYADSRKGLGVQVVAAYDRLSSGDFMPIDELRALASNPPTEPAYGVDYEQAVVESGGILDGDKERILANLMRVKDELPRFAGRSRVTGVDAELMQVSVDDQETELWIKSEERLLLALARSMYRVGGANASAGARPEPALPTITLIQVGQDTGARASILVSGEEIRTLISDVLKPGVGFESARRTFASGLATRLRARADNAKDKFRNFQPTYNEKLRTAAAQYVERIWPQLPLDTLLPWQPAKSRADATRPDRATLAAYCVALASQLTPSDPSRGELDHIIVDEAQDLSEMELRFLATITRGSSVTMVGDIRQSTRAGSDRQEWDEIAKIFPEKLKVDRMDLSLRSTQEITEFGNEILKLRGIRKKAKAFPRSGPEVVVKHAPDQHPDRRSIASWITELGDATGTSAIILPPGASEQRKQEIVSMDASWSLLTSREYMKVLTSGADSVEATTHATQRRVVLSADEAKGLEFNHVLVLQADADAYPGTAQGGALLYVACTRATRKLDVVYWGTPSPFLPLPKKKRGA
jgi:DNA helicase IV